MKKLKLLSCIIIFAVLIIQKGFAQFQCNPSLNLTYMSPSGNIIEGKLIIEKSQLGGSFIIYFPQRPCGPNAVPGCQESYSAFINGHNYFTSNQYAPGGFTLTIPASDFTTGINNIVLRANCFPPMNPSGPPNLGNTTCDLRPLTVEVLEDLPKVQLGTECELNAGNPTGRIRYKIQSITGTVNSGDQIRMVFDGATTYHPLLANTFIDITNITANNVMNAEPYFSIMRNYAVLANAKINGAVYNSNNGYHFKSGILNNTCVPANAIAVTLTPECCKGTDGKNTGKVKFKMTGNACTGSRLQFVVNGVTTWTPFINNTYTDCYNYNVAITLMDLMNQRTGTVNGSGFSSALNCNLKYNPPMSVRCIGELKYVTGEKAQNFVQTCNPPCPAGQTCVYGICQ